MFHLWRFFHNLCIWNYCLIHISLKVTLAYTIWHNHKQTSLFRKCVGWPQKKSQNSAIFNLKLRCWHKDQEVALYAIIGASLKAGQCRPM